MPFEKGKSGNPGGRPKEKLFRAALIMELKAAGEDMPDLREIAKNLIARAKNTDAACNALMDRLDGKVPQAVVGSDGEDPINLRAKVLARVIIDPGNPESGNSDAEEIQPAAGPGEGLEGAWGARGAQRPLLEVKRTWRGLVAMSAKDTKRTYGTVLAAIGLRHQPRYNQNRLDIWECGA
jgi:hypothetical protein